MSSHTFKLAASLALALSWLGISPGDATAQIISDSEPAPRCARTLTADVVALDQPFFWNRLGAMEPQGMIYALRRDVVSSSGSFGLQPGNVQLRSNKRPRPLVLRMNVGDCLRIEFENLLNPVRGNGSRKKQPNTRTASVHAVGLQLVSSMLDDGSYVGTNSNALVAPGQAAVYTYYGQKEGSHLIYSSGALVGGEGEGGSISSGLFGSINVEPRGSVWYRSQVTEQELSWAHGFSSQVGGHPVINYNATYPGSSPYSGVPILKMLNASNEIVHSDLTAIIAGPNNGRFSDGTYPDVEVYRDRNEPFREFTIIFHDEIGAVQAFPIFEDQQMEHTLHSVRDAFAINYGTGGIGAEILANRLGVGPMYDCVTCKYEEFFLSAWTVGDPAMVVDVPANATDSSGTLITGPKATVAHYPDDPSNVYHSYLNDHVKFRNLLAGSDDHHIFHLHAHQWLHTPNSDNSTYLDSQAIGQGASYTYEIAYDGSGNRNKTPGDSIFHCHFYPHFAQGMWAMWRVHDVFEGGTPLDEKGRPKKGSRAYPDAEILAGTPIPGLVPLPSKPMAPLPAAQVSINNGQVQVTGVGNPGFPFYIPAVAGQRPPGPPLDKIHDGGLPRHVVTAGTTTEVHTRLDFSKDIHKATALEIPEAGTVLENAAMTAHEQRQHATCLPDGTCDSIFNPIRFLYNGAARQPGAPLADPCIDDDGNPIGKPRTYKAANIQMDVIFNKEGWHFSQQRLLSLWDDVPDFLFGNRPPEPFFIRANTNDCVEYWHSNLVPAYYEQDDFEVRTPTDILGQHIHLVKFDVLASDGGANGWNYEDGTLSPEEVRHMITAINADGGIIASGGTQRKTLVAETHPVLGAGPGGDWIGAQTTVQRWFVDDVLNLQGTDRTLRTVFTHDHFGPSTHQQVGLYAGLVVEKEGSVWRHPESGAIFGTRDDGGPTGWRADIIETNPNCLGGELPPIYNSELDACVRSSYREFLLEYSDFQSAYWDGKPVNPPECPNHLTAPCPEAVSAADPGTMVLNYRNEPLALRVWDPTSNSQASGQAGDMSFAYSSQVNRALSSLNTQPPFYAPLTEGVRPRDPYTPLLPVYEDDPVQIRVLVGGFEEEHNFNIHGTKWLFEPSDPNSGFRSSQMMGISEHHEFVVPRLPSNFANKKAADYLYKPGASVDGQWNGLWGILRVYADALDADGLDELPTNRLDVQPEAESVQQFSNGICPNSAPRRTYDIVAVSAVSALPGGTLVYNSRSGYRGPLHDPTAILYVRQSDLDFQDRLLPSAPIEPLILRANAGDCLEVTLRNAVTTPVYDLPGDSKLPKLVKNFNADHVQPSENVGLHTQLLYHDITRSDGLNVGINPVQSVSPGQISTYQWYAGDVVFDTNTLSWNAIPMEFGAVPLSSSDPIKHTNKGLVGALIVEPQGSTWTLDPGTYASATVNPLGAKSFREFVLVYQDDINLRFKDGEMVPNLHVANNAAESGQNAFNYRTEPAWFRLGYPPQQDPQTTIDRTDLDVIWANSTVGGDPETPLFSAKAGSNVRFRVVHPGGHGQNHTFSLHGHTWQELPWVANSTRMGDNPLSEEMGFRDGLGPTGHWNFVLENGAGGLFGVPGDYMYRDLVPWYFASGLWGILRVEN